MALGNDSTAGTNSITDSICFLHMKPIQTIGCIAGSIILIVLFPAAQALATQGHAGIEGVWVHQFAHLFFLFSMMLLIFWLRQAGLVKAPGWRYIQYAALFFILWNMDTMLVHFLDEQIQAVRVEIWVAGGFECPPPAIAAGWQPCTTFPNLTICCASRQWFAC